MQKNSSTIDEYITLQSTEVRPILEKIRQTIHEAAPEAKEVISYSMPAFKTSEVLVYFAAQKDHIGFYPTSSLIKAFAEELKKYKTSKGTIRFSYHEPIPYDLITKITKFRLAETKP